MSTNIWSIRVDLVDMNCVELWLRSVEQRAVGQMQRWLHTQRSEHRTQMALTLKNNEHKTTKESTGTASEQMRTTTS